MVEGRHYAKPNPPPRWLLWVFLAITGGLALYPGWIGSVASLIPLIAANVIFLILERSGAKQWHLMDMNT
jgi:hypothetical protein